MISCLVGCSQFTGISDGYQTTTMTLIEATHLPPTKIPVTPTSSQTKTFSPTSTPPLTSLPTLCPEAEQLEIARLLATNDDCSGNCFWGIQPRVTNFNKAVQYLDTLNGGYESALADYVGAYRIEEKSIFIDLEVSRGGERVQSVKARILNINSPVVNGKDWLAFRPESILTRYGIPNDVVIGIGSGPEGHGSYGMVLLYDQMYVMYDGWPITVTPTTVYHSCPFVENNFESFDIWLGTYDEEDFDDSWVDLTQLTSISSEDLSRILNNPEQACFDLNYEKYLSLAQ